MGLPVRTSIKTGGCRRGQTRIWLAFRGLNCTFMTGQGKVKVRSQFPVTTSQTETVLSVEALNIWRLFRLQLVTDFSKYIYVTFRILNFICLLHMTNYLIEQTGCEWATIIFAILRVTKSHISMRPSLHPTETRLPGRLNWIVTTNVAQPPDSSFFIRSRWPSAASG